MLPYYFHFDFYLSLFTFWQKVEVKNYIIMIHTLPRNFLVMSALAHILVIRATFGPRWRPLANGMTDWVHRRLMMMKMKARIFGTPLVETLNCPFNHDAQYLSYFLMPHGNICHSNHIIQHNLSIFDSFQTFMLFSNLCRLKVMTVEWNNLVDIEYTAISVGGLCLQFFTLNYWYNDCLPGMSLNGLILPRK